jgi:ABC-type glycerol-3-phosphate transport system substrate-binding protein
MLMARFDETFQTPVSRKDLLKKAGVATAAVAASGSLLSTFADAASPISFGGETVRMLMFTNDDSKYVASTLVPRLKAVANINLKVDIVPYGEIRAKQLADRAGPKTYDIADAYTEVSYEYRPFSIDLTPYLSKPGYPKLDVPDVIPYVWNGWNPSRKMNFLPYQPDTRLFFYRTDLLQKAGLQPPKTWDEFLTAAKKLTGNGVYGWVVPSTRADPNLTLAWVPMFFSAGGHLFDAAGAPALNSKAGLDAINLMISLKAYAPPDILTYGEYETDQAFTKGLCAMTISASALAPQIQQAASKVKGKVAAGIFPPQKAGFVPDYVSILGGWAFSVTSYSSHKDAAAYAAMWLASPQIVTDLEIHGRQHAARTSMMKNKQLLVEDPFVPAIVHTLERSQLFYKGVKSSNLQDSLTLRLSQALSGELSAKAALDSAQADWKKILGK